MKRASAGGLIAVVVVVTALGVAGTLIPLKPCASCSGLFHHLHFLQSPSIPPVVPPPIGCPDCADRGQVSLFRSWLGPGISPGVAAILHEIVHQERPSFYAPLKELVIAEGKDPLKFIQANDSNAVLEKIRFIEAEGETFLVLIIDASLRGFQGMTATAVLLLSPEGRALDSVLVGWIGEQGELSSRLLDNPRSTGEFIVVDSKMRTKPLSVAVDQWQRPRQERVFAGTFDPEICSLSIHGRRYEIRLQHQR